MRVVHWLRHLASAPGLAQVAVLLTLVTIMVLFIPRATLEPCIRWWGMLLQVVGIASVVRELRQKRQESGVPTMFSSFTRWWSRRPGQNVTIPITGVAAVGQAGNVSKAHGAVGITPDATVDQRLRFLEDLVGTMSNSLYNLGNELDAEKRERQRAQAAGRAERLAAEESFRKASREAVAKTLPFSMFGVIWLALGVVLSSTSVELAHWVPKLFR